MCCSGESPYDTLARADAVLLWTKEHARGGVTVATAEGDHPALPRPYDVTSSRLAPTR
jgi:hypothetical protein